MCHLELASDREERVDFHRQIQFELLVDILRSKQCFKLLEVALGQKVEHLALFHSKCHQ